MLGQVDQCWWQGPHYPNGSSTWNTHATYINCTDPATHKKACLFNVIDDETGETTKRQERDNKILSFWAPLSPDETRAWFAKTGSGQTHSFGTMAEKKACRPVFFSFVLFLRSFVLNNVTEHHDVSASHPEIVESLLSRMEEVQRTVFDPDRGLRDLQGACKSLEDNGGFWSPWLTPEELPHEMQLQQMAAVVPGLE